MESLKKWVVCLDLTKMDDAVIGYVNFFASLIKPESIRFLHVIESYDLFQDLIEEYPELETEEDLNELLIGRIQEKIDQNLNFNNIKKDIQIRKGSATDQIIKLMDSSDSPDLLILGKKAAYKGEGVLARRIVKYVPCSVLFVPETARYTMENITVPTDFSEQSETAAQFALNLVKPAGGQVVAQHLFDYPKQFFPYMPDKKTIKEMNDNLEASKKTFLGRVKTPGDTNLEMELTLHRDGKISDGIYDLCVTNKTDMIVVFSKARSNMLSFVSDKLPDRMASYNFGIPLLILKNKKKNQQSLIHFLKG